MDIIQKELLSQVADLHEVPEGAYNIRANGESVGRNTTANIDIVTKTDVSGIDIYIKPGTKKESIHIPVDTLLDPNAELELEFDAEGKLVDTFVWD